MTFELIILSKAKIELSRVAIWYEEKLSGLGHKFLSMVNSKLEYLSVNPYSYRIRFDSYRSAKVANFPYIVHYFIDGNKVIVVSIIHSSRKPKTWLK